MSEAPDLFSLQGQLANLTVESTKANAPSLPLFSRKTLREMQESIPRLTAENRAELMTSLRAIPDLQVFDSHFQHLTSGVAYQTSLSDLADWLLIRSVEAGAHQALLDVSTYLSQDVFPAIDVLVVGGVRCNERIQLTRDVSMIPFVTLPQSEAKEALRRVLHGSTVPLSALVKDTHQPRIHFTFSDMSALVRDFDESPEQLLAIARILSLTIDSAVTPISSWQVPRSDVPVRDPASRSLFDMPFREPSNRAEVVEATSETFKNLWQDYSQCDEAFRQKVLMLTKRLSDARARRDMTDAFIDLGIALEGIFIDGKTDSSELTFKLTNRAARFLRDELSERRRVTQILSHVYDLRSQAVHGGQVDGAKKTQASLRDDFPNSRAFLEYGCTLAAEAMRDIVHQRAWPDWQEVMLR